MQVSADAYGVLCRFMTSRARTRGPQLDAAHCLLTIPDAHCSNDDFLLHYGFVPAGNVHDDFILFDSTDEALQWHRAKFPLKVPGNLCC